MPSDGLHDWRDAWRGPDGPDSTSRLILYCLSDWFRAFGDGAHPSQKRIAEQTGLSVRAVRQRLKDLDGVWISRVQECGKATRYLPRTPERDAGVGDEPRHEVPGTPAGDAGDPGRRCRRTSSNQKETTISRGESHADQQLPMASVLLRAIEGGDRDEFDRVSEELKHRTRNARSANEG